MAPTPYPQNLFHVGTAKPLALDVGFAPEPTGDITISVGGNAASQGWPSIPGGQKMIITIGRGTIYEQKHLVSSVSSGQTSSTLTVLAVDRNYDGTTPTDAPAGTLVEHTVSATEMATINDHMRTKQAHGSDGDLVDVQSAQTLANKTLTSPTLNNPTINGAQINDPVKFEGARLTPVGAIMMWATETVPAGWLVCDGQAFDPATYPLLATLFPSHKVPDLTDSYVKGGTPTLNTPKVSTNDKKITEAQMPTHNHGVSLTAAGSHTHSAYTDIMGSHNHGSPYTSSYIHFRWFAVRNSSAAGYEQLAVNGQTLPAYGQTLPADGHHGHNVTINGVANHNHTVSQTSKGGSANFNVEPQHVVMRYIICATDQ